jgi:hypothetical protein
LLRRVNTSYVTVEPKRRKNPSPSKEGQEEAARVASPLETSSNLSPQPGHSQATSNAGAVEKSQQALQEIADPEPAVLGSRGQSAGRELRRARIVITVRRTESYTRWLEENPLQAMIANDGTIDAALEKAPGSHVGKE